MHTPTLDGVFLKFETALQETLELPNGHSIFLASWLNKEEHASVSGEVYSIGPTCELKYVVNGIEYKVQSGDTVACSYHVVARHTLDKDGVTTYHNCHRVGNDKVWLAREVNIMAVKKDGWHGVNEWVLMTEAFEKPLTSSFLELPESTQVPVLKKGRGIYLSGDVDAILGQEVVFKEDYRSVYRIGTEKYIILNKDRIEGKLLKSI